MRSANLFCQAYDGRSPTTYARVDEFLCELGPAKARSHLSANVRLRWPPERKLLARDSR